MELKPKKDPMYQEWDEQDQQEIEGLEQTIKHFENKELIRRINGEILMADCINETIKSLKLALEETKKEIRERNGD